MNTYSDPNPGPFPNPNPNPFPNADPGLYPNSNPFPNADPNPYLNANPGLYPNPNPAPGMNPKPGTNRRLLIIIGVLAIVLLGLVAAAIAVINQHSTPTTASSSTPTVGVTTSGATTTKAKTRRVIGVIQSINAQSILILPQNKKKPIAVMLTSTTKYKTTSGKASVSDLKVGQTVEVNEIYDTQSNVWNATRITISPNLATPTATP
jgi:hypothetical protein